MERFFRVTPGTALDLEYKKWKSEGKKINEAIIVFFWYVGIEADYYQFSAKNMNGKPLVKGSEKNVRLSIKPTAEDVKNFGEQLNKPDENGFCRFRHNSVILKDFAKFAVEHQLCYISYPRILFGLWRICDCAYGKSSSFSFIHNDILYGTIRSEVVREPYPKGVVEILGSEFYKILEDNEVLMLGGDY